MLPLHSIINIRSASPATLAVGALLLSINSAIPQEIAQVDKKNRIVFDAAEPAASPAQSPSTSEPNAASTPPASPSEAESARKFQPPAVPWSPAGQPEGTPNPAPSPEPEPAAAPQKAASSTPAAVSDPLPEPPNTAPPTGTIDRPSLAEAASPSPATAGAVGPEGALPTEPNVLADQPQLGSGEPPTPSQSVTVNLINKLVQRGILAKEDAADMITQAEAEAETARSIAQADMFAIAQIAAAQAAADQVAIAQAANAPANPDDVRVTYIPEPVKLQIKEDIKLELATERATNRWATGIVLPQWVERMRPFGDLRVRYEGDFFPPGNDNTGAFPNFNAINTGAPFDVTGNQFAPQLNVDQNRNRFRIRARLGIDVDLGENFTSGFRIATGSDNSPTSTNQTLGQAAGQGGNFSKYAIWLDRAFLKYELGAGTSRNLQLLVGRFDNPFFSTPVIWDDDLGFDGVALRAKYEVFPGVTPFLNGGAFPVYNTDFNFASNQPAKFASYDKYLFAVQGGLDWKPTPDWNFKAGVAYYYFYNIEGKRSTPYTPQSPNDASDTDNSRPAFAQKGNTYMAIRDILPDASNDFGAINQWQYFGLASKFENLAVTARLDYNGFEPVQVSLVGEWVTNLAFNKSLINTMAVNNRGPLDNDEINAALGEFEGSGNAWYVEGRVGTPALAKRWDWLLTFGYRWIGSDAVVDGFNDSDFGLGGTNMKGLTASGSLSLASNVWLSMRWMGADSIAGPQYKVNIFQLDINSRF